MVSLNATENKQFWMILLQKRRMHSNTAPNPVFDGAPSPKGRHHAQKLSYGPASQPAMHRSDPPSVPSPATAPLRAIAPPHSATPRSSPYTASPALPPSISSRSPSPSPLASPSPSVPSPLQTRPSPQPSHGNIISPPAYIPSPSSTVPAYIPSPSSTVPKARIPSAVVRAPPYPSATTTPSFSPGPLAQRSPGTTPVSSPIPLSKFSHPASSYLEPSTGVSSSVSSAINFSEKHVSAAGITAIAVAGIIVVVVVGFFIWYRKKRKDEYGDYRGPSSGSFSYKSGGMYVSERGPWPDNSSSSSQYPIRSLTLPSTSSGSVNGYSGVNGSVGGCALGVSQPRNASLGPGMGNWKSWFTYEELIVATNGFSRENLLGEGAFGRVYKGYMQDGQVVAVKQLKVGGHQGECEFRAEVEIIGRVHHRHLVSLVGYCIADSQRLLVYEYVPNGTLEHHLHEKGKLVIDWATRLKIAIGAARGLAYLHEDCHPRIIHRDIKSANILLDNNFEAQVSDFGLAKLAPDTYTHVTTCVVGTFGYLAPEYASSGKLSERSDVYSFGVLLLELVTGQRPIDTSRPIGNESLIEWARPLLNRALEDGEVESLADPKLGNNFDVDEMLCMVKAAAACVRHSAERRPRMGQVVRALENDVGNPDLSNGVKPGDSSRYDPAFIRTFYMMAFGNQEYGSEYNEEISDYGLNPYV